MSEEVCNHTSVGMLVKRDEEILFIERRKFPFGWAPPAGHVDDDESYETAAERELSEEVGLAVESMKLILEEDKQNHCRRIDGTWHHWKVYDIETIGEVKTAENEVKNYEFLAKNAIQTLADRTRRYLAGEISEQEWENDPGLEPVWYEMLTKLEIIKN